MAWISAGTSIPIGGLLAQIVIKEGSLSESAQILLVLGLIVTQVLTAFLFHVRRVKTAKESDDE